MNDVRGGAGAGSVRADGGADGGQGGERGAAAQDASEGVLRDAWAAVLADMTDQCLKLRAAAQAHHDTKYNRLDGPGNRTVINPVDLALYEAADIEHSKLGFADGGCLRTLEDLKLADAVRALVRGAA